MTNRALRFAVVTAYPHEDWHSERVIDAFRRVGEVVVVDPGDLSASVGGVGLEVSLAGEDVPSLDAFVLVRGLSPRGDPDAQFTIYRALEESGALVVNRIGPLLDAQDKFRTSLLLHRAGVRTPRAAVVQTPGAASQSVSSWPEAVLKPLAGSLGEGVERLASGPAGRERAEQRLADEGAVYLQEWVPNPGRDVRVFVVGARAVVAVERVAAPGEFRSNVARGATARALQLRPETALLAERASAALGLDYSGVDVIETASGPEVIEVNGNPSFDMFFEAMGLDVSDVIARYVAARATQRRQSWAARGSALRGAVDG